MRNNMHFVNEDSLRFACTIALPDSNAICGHERIRQLSQTSAGRSWMHVTRGRPPRDANAHTCTVYVSLQHEKPRAVSFPARFRARENSTNKRVARRKLYIVRNNTTLWCYLAETTANATFRRCQAPLRTVFTS